MLNGSPATVMRRRLRMKNQVFFLFMICIVLTSLFLVMTNRQRPTIHSIVTETQNQLKNLKNNFHDERRLDVDDALLAPLGLTTDDQLWPESVWHRLRNASEPVIVSAVQTGHAGEAVNFLRNSFVYLPNHTVILYDLGLSYHELELVEKYCGNSSLCSVVPFDFAAFPAHVRELGTNAFRPIAIQLALKDAGCVLWLDISQRFTRGDLGSFLSSALSSGLLAWLAEPLLLPTTALTHPKMFPYFGVANLENYNFQHMISLDALLLYNVPRVHTELVLPWVKCALIEECIEPIGAQAAGCRFDKKPQYRYSGCHGYDVSALNIVLGKMFQFNEGRYVAKESFFVRMTEEENDEEAMNGTEVTGTSKKEI